VVVCCGGGMLMIPVRHKERDDEETEGGYRTQIV
jgi:hypothetical protein